MPMLARGFIFGLESSSTTYFIYVSSKDSGGSVHMPEPSLLDDAIRTYHFEPAH